MVKQTLIAFFTLATVLSGSAVSAQDEYVQHWNGKWIADGTLFQVGVAVENNVMKLTQIESMGFIWSSKAGSVEGNILRVDVSYAGVTGTIQAELVDANTAVAFAASCMPEFMVVCALARDRQAIFRKILSD